MNFKIPEMFFHMKNLIPFLTLKLNLSNKKISKSENKKIVISPLRLKALILKLYRQIKRFRHATILFLKTVRFIKANIQIMFAAEDPAVSCFIVGGVLSFLYFILSFISYYINFDKSSISLNVKPVNFMSNSIKVFFSGIIELRIAHIIIGGLLLFVVWLFPERIDIKLRRAKKYGWTSH